MRRSAPVVPPTRQGGEVPKPIPIADRDTWEERVNISVEIPLFRNKEPYQKETVMEQQAFQSEAKIYSSSVTHRGERFLNSTKKYCKTSLVRSLSFEKS